MDENNMGQPSSSYKDLYKEIQPTTTRKESIPNDRTGSPCDDNDTQSSSTYMSRSASYRSGIVLAKNDQVLPKRLPKCWPQKKKLIPRRPPGRIMKKKKLFPKKATRRKQVRSLIKTKNLRRKPMQNPSVHTLFTAKSSKSSFVECNFCGHRCCRRYNRRRQKNVRVRRLKLRQMQRIRRRPKEKPLRMVSVLEGVQAGSAHWALSPLFISSTFSPPAPTREADHIEVTPRMIHQSLQAIAKWTEAIKTSFLVNYLQRFYPVNTNKEELTVELLEKLRISVLTGTVIQTAPDCWTLPHSLYRRRLSETKLSQFWRIYADTMQPIGRKIDIQRESPQTENRTEDKNFSKRNDEPPPDYII